MYNLCEELAFQDESQVHVSRCLRVLPPANTFMHQTHWDSGRSKLSQRLEFGTGSPKSRIAS
eukprot:4820155-Prorocentrum_lima.AAC.1